MAVYINVRRAGILRNVELNLPGKGVTLLLGPNGAGKTTLLKTIAGVIRADAEIIVNGVELHVLPPSRRRVAYVPQSLALFNHMAVYDNIAYGLRARGLGEKEVRERVLALADMLRVTHLLSRMPWMLSGGEKQRVAIARALAIDARMLLLDEAFDHIDAESRRALMTYISEYAAEKMPVILVTHHPEEAMRHMDVKAVVRLVEGRLHEIRYTRGSEPWREEIVAEAINPR
ncbi:hypothetical protein PYJP_00410 [Pyrofollis japonicus]|uniref:ATP-binding cassette domain-containing protein n=1 Tax=Pyrofollis japonicus TaxID=3060460 RepID=UPI00295C1D02|nr:ATP-binding cassette domain-containing protein [Pyrofollis japonicus]BEP16689.1 hypothetical protein PYJP_00410 [Pyrofollis japonicus]